MDDKARGNEQVHRQVAYSCVIFITLASVPFAPLTFWPLERLFRLADEGQKCAAKFTDRFSWNMGANKKQTAAT